MEERSLLICPKEAHKLLSMSRSKFDEMKRIAGFPKPRYPAGKRPMYVRQELEEWVNNLPII